MKSFLLVVTFLVSVLCLNDFSLAQNETPEKTFWGWVQEHQDFLYNLDETNQDQLKQFDEQLNKEAIGEYDLACCPVYFDMLY